MQILVAVLLSLVTSQGLASALRAQVKSLVGAKLSSSLAIVAKINEVDEDGRNVLHHAAILGDLPLVKFFIDHGANLRTSDNDDLIPLRYAERIASERQSISHMQVASLLLEKTRGVNRGDEKGWRAIVWSIMARDIPRIKELLANGADILSGPYNNQYLAGWHNAVWAAEHLNDDEIIDILAEHAPADYLPLIINDGYRKFTQAMIKRGVDINIKDGYGFSAAQRIARAGRNNDLQMLIANGAQLDGGILAKAIFSGNPEVVETILSHNDKIADELVFEIILGAIDKTSTDTILKKITTTSNKIHQLLITALTSEQLPLLATLNQLDWLRKNIRYPWETNLLLIAIDRDLEQESRQLFDFLKKDGLADRIALVNQELLRWIAVANRTNNNKLKQRLLTWSNGAGINSKELLKRAELLKKLEDKSLKISNNPEIEAVLQAIKQNDRETLQGLINYRPKIEEGALDRISYQLAKHDDGELFEFLVAEQIVDLDYNSFNRSPSFLKLAVSHRNLSLLEKIISLGGKAGIDEALISASCGVSHIPNKSFVISSTPEKSSTELAEEQQLSMIRVLVESGANVNARQGSNSRPLTEAIKSLQPSRVKFLLEQGAVVGNIDSALNYAEYIVGLRNNDEERKKLANIKRLLATFGKN